MTLRKLSQDGHQVRRLPYPASPSSPPQQVSQANIVAMVSDEAISREDEVGILDSGSEAPKYNQESNSDLPSSLRIGSEDTTRPSGEATNTLPTSLQIGASEITPRSSFDSQPSSRPRSPSPPFAGPQHSMRSKLASNNPFLQQKSSTVPKPTSPAGEESSATIWGNASGGEPQHIFDGKDNGSILWDEPTKSQPPPSKNGLPHSKPFEENTTTANLNGAAFDDPWNDPSTFPKYTQDPQILPDYGTKNNAAIINTSSAGLDESLQHHSINDDYRQRPLQSPEVEKDLPSVPDFNAAQIAPALPPRRSTNELQDYPPPKPPRPQDGIPPPKPPRPRVDTNITDIDTSIRAQAESERRKKQRSETYQIRLVNWYDATASRNPRRSPIMVQNANGPCPLLALVNALVLSTPSGVDTALLDTLERREQVSLGLLLDAVIDELMSGRRGDAAQNLPDVSELYAFLVNLHTGMNVNPIFLPKASEPLHLLDAPISNDSTSLSNYGTAGGFEETREMKLYSTFAVPLIHGWLPASSHPACAALRRSAKTYEDAQNLMFAEEELENKLSRHGLTQEEQGLLQDIASVKYFLSSSATQLTGYGLNQITESLSLGSIAILFRNDHFSTLYRNPRSGQLFTLVTDMGYAGHDEVVWESLVDVNGEGCEFFAGDFRPVGNNTTSTHPLNTNDGDGWTTVRRSNVRSHGNSMDVRSDVAPQFSSLHIEDSTQDPTSPKAEQEDHDLALALQLQEEEEERERRESAARRREDELSRAFLSSQPGSRGSGAKRGEPRPSIPPRGNTRGRARGGVARGGLQHNGPSAAESPAPTQTEDGEDAPPPTYEQAARGPAYHPPANHPAHPNAATANSPSQSAQAYTGLQRQSSAYMQQSSGQPDSPYTGSPSTPGSRFRNNAGRTSTPGRGPSGVEGAPGVYRRNGSRLTEEPGRDRDCVIM